MKRKDFNKHLPNLVEDSMKIQSFLERSSGCVKSQTFRCKYLQLSLAINYYNVEVSYINDSIRIRFDDYLGRYCLKHILRLFPYDSFIHTIYSNGTYTIKPIKS